MEVDEGTMRVPTSFFPPTQEIDIVVLSSGNMMHNAYLSESTLGFSEEIRSRQYNAMHGLGQVHAGACLE